MLYFTTGEWKYEEYVPNGVTINGKEYIIYTGSVNPKEPGEDIALARREADAQLIAAAPEMYELLMDYHVDPAEQIAWLIRRHHLLARIDGEEAHHG